MTGTPIQDHINEFLKEALAKRSPSNNHINYAGYIFVENYNGQFTVGQVMVEWATANTAIDDQRVTYNTTENVLRGYAPDWSLRVCLLDKHQPTQELQIRRAEEDSCWIKKYAQGRFIDLITPPKPKGISIKSDGTPMGTKVFVDGELTPFPVTKIEFSPITVDSLISVTLTVLPTELDINIPINDEPDRLKIKIDEQHNEELIDKIRRNLAVPPSILGRRT